MRLHFFGVRGSTPAAGAQFTRYGGHTSCVGVAHADETPRLVLDAGTGLELLSRQLGGAPFHGTVLLGHLHWDHTHGIPFFRAGDRPDATVAVRGPVAPGVSLLDLLERVMAPPNFPITPSELRGAWSFGSLEEGRHQFEGFALEAREIPHKGGRTFGYRVEGGGRAIAYLSDHCPTALGPGRDGLGERHDAALALARDVDILVHDAQYTARELPERAEFGHSAIEYAVSLGAEAGAKAVVLFHHDPHRTDQEIDALARTLPTSSFPIVMAREGLVLDADVVVGAGSGRGRR